MTKNKNIGAVGKTTTDSSAACDCGLPAVYLRQNEGRHYCGSCLTKQVEKRFLKEIGRTPLTKSDTIAVGVSGGKDSMVLVHLFNKLTRKTGAKLFAITIDEGIAGYRDKSISMVKDFAAALGLEHHIFSFKNEFGLELDNLKGVKFCTYCGVFRRYLLNKKARELGATKLAIGHNLDDEAQSVLMNVLRGTTGKALSQSKRFVPRIKPLKHIAEKEIVVYAIINRISYSDGECPYSFDNTRRDVQTVLNGLEEKYPGTKSRIMKFSRSMQPTPKDGETGQCSRCGEPTSKDVCKACELVAKARK